MPLYLGKKRLNDCCGNKSNTILVPPRPSGTSGPNGAVQLSSGEGGTLTHNPDIYVSTEPTGSDQINRLILDSSISNPFSEPLTRLRFIKPPNPQTGSSIIPKDGDIAYWDDSTGSGLDLRLYKGTSWVSLTTASGAPSVAALPNNGIQFCEPTGITNPSLNASQNFTFDTTQTPNLFTVGDSNGILVNTNLSGDLTHKGILNSSDADLVAGTAIISSDASAFSTNPGILLRYDAIIASNAPAIQLETTNFAGIKLTSLNGDIDTSITGSGAVDIKTTTGAIKLERDQGVTSSSVLIGSTGDITLNTTDISNEIRLLTSGIGSEIILSTSANTTPIQLNATGVSSTIELTANTIIECKSEILEITNNASNGSLAKFRDATAAGVTINGGGITAGIDAGIVIGDDSQTGQLQIKNGSVGNTVVKLNVDSNNNGVVDISGSSGNSGVFMTSDSTGGLVKVLDSTSAFLMIRRPPRSTQKIIGVDGSGTSEINILYQGIPEERLGHRAAGTGVNAVGSGVSSVITGTLAILPNSKYLGAASTTPNYTNNPQPDANILLGQYGWGTIFGAQPNNVNSSWRNNQNSIGYGGSGNIYCNQIRENLYYVMPTSANAPGTTSNPGGRSWGGSGAFAIDAPPNLLYPSGQGSHQWGYLGNTSVKGWYNNGNIRHLMIDVGGSVSGSSGANTAGAGINSFASEVRLPKINEAMVGMKVTVTRVRVPSHNPNGAGPGAYVTSGLNTTGKIEFHKIAVVIKSSGNVGADTDLISAPDSIVVFDATQSSPHVALDPYRVLVPYPNGVSNTTSGYRGNEQINRWTVDINPTPLTTREFPRTATTALVPGVTISQLNGATIFYGTVEEVIEDQNGDVIEIIFTSPAGTSGTAGVYNFQSTLDLYIGGAWNTIPSPNISGEQTINASAINLITRVNLGAAPNPSFPENAGFTYPYTSISSATFLASAIGNGNNQFGPVNPDKYVWTYIDSYPSR
jgi:hypothetical protein